uniref:Uncharacterized protein n=1 Tax=Oncorhynchus tshawytscha TaxID=74940 RepID=A0AAZ3QFB8_ONCTS
MPMIDLPAFRTLICSRESQREVRQVLSGDTEREPMEGVHLEKKKNRVQGYRQAIASQSQQLMEECSRLSQEQESLTGEKSRGCGCSEGGEGGSGEEAGGFLQHPGVLGEEAGNGDGRAGREQALAQLDMEAGFKNIFKNDLHCAQSLNMDKRKNDSSDTGSCRSHYRNTGEQRPRCWKHSLAIYDVSGIMLQTDIY